MQVMPFTVEDKIKPYTVVDLTTHTILSPEEIDNCLKEASEKQFFKWIGEYQYNGNHAKANGDAPNFVSLPPKKRSKSEGSLYSILKSTEYEKKTSNLISQENENENDIVGAYRGRSYTAPAICSGTVAIRSPRRKQTKGARTLPPSSPGVAKRKVQHKLQQQQQPSKLAMPAKLRSQASPGSTGIALPKQSGLRAPTSRPPPSRVPSAEPQNSSLKAPEQIATPRSVSAMNRITLANQRSTLPRLSSKNSDARSDSSSSDGGSQRTTPVMKNSVSPPVSGISIPQARSSITKPKSSLPSRTANDNKRSLDNLRMKREMSADCLRTKREKSSDCLRKLSSASVPSTRIKQSTESLQMSRESTADNLKSRYNSTSSINSQASVESDYGELKKSTENFSTGIKKPVSGLRKPTSGISSPRKVPTTGGGELKLKQPAAAILRPSGLAKSSGIAKSGQIKQPISKYSGTSETKIGLPSSQAKIKAPEEGTQSVSPASQLKNEIRQTQKTSPNDASRLATKLQAVKVSEKVIEQSFKGCQREMSRDEEKVLKHPTVGKLPERLQNEPKFNRPLRFQPKVLNKPLPSNATDARRIDKTEDQGVVKAKIALSSEVTPCIENPDEMPIQSPDCQEKSEILEGISYDQDPFSEFDDKFRTDSELTNDSDADELTLRHDNLSQKNVDMIMSRRSSGDSDSDVENTSCHDQSAYSRYMEPDDSIKRSEQLSSDSGYIEPIDTLSSSRNSITQYRQQMSNNSSNYLDETSSSNESNTSPHFGQCEPSPGYIDNEAGKYFEDPNNAHPDSKSSSPFKRFQPKVMIPPPRLNSYTDDLLAPLPKEYMRTPSSDIDEIQLIKHKPSDEELRRLVREQAIKVWGKKPSQSNDEDEPLRESDDEENTLAGGELNDSDVFYASKDLEHKTSDALERYAARTSLRRASEEEQYPFEAKQIESMTLDRKEKKTSKLKKFFKKLSHKKDGKCENELVLRNDRLPSTDSENNRLSSASGYDFKTRRRSDGTVSLYSVNDVNYLTQATPMTKRRMFAINLSFMRKGRRQRSNTTVLNTTNDDKPSDTIRALCSPYVTRRNVLSPLSATNGRRASETTVYRIQNSNDQQLRRSTSPPIINTALRHTSKKYRAPQPPSNLPPLVVTTNTTTAPPTTTPLTSIVTQPLNISMTTPRGSRGSASSLCEEADYINYPFSKSNIKAPQKPSRSGDKGSCSDPYGNHLRSNSISSSSKASSNDDYNRTIRHSVLSDDSMVMSSESLSSSQGNNEVFEAHSAPSTRKQLKPNTRSDSSLRKTPLRNSIDSYNKLLEVHRQTIDKISVEVSRLVCSCEQLRNHEWNDFQRSDDVINLNLRSYMVVPVTCPKSENKNYTAWLRIDQQNQSLSPKPQDRVNYSKTTLHRNCLHVCHAIEPAYTSPFEDRLPKSIEVNRAFISTQSPKMTLSKYVVSTIEKHTRYPEIYEREMALILLQVVKGVTYLVRKRNPLKSVTSENVFILNNSELEAVVSSPKHQSAKCPAVVVGCLPGIGDVSTTSMTSSDTMTNLCHQMAFLLYELLHSPFEEELKLIVNSPMLFTTLPDLTIKSIYSRYLQSIIDKLLGTPQHNINSLDELRLTLEIILFGPTDICDHEEKEALSLIKKWHNRRCVDMVTHILKEAPLIMLCASEHHGQEVEKIKRVDQEILLECEFLSTILPADIYRVSKELRR